MTATARPGEWVDHAPGLDDLAGSFNLRISTDRYRSREYADRERDAIWLKTWQVAGRVDDLPKVGDWMEYKIYDQSFLIVRGKDEKLRGFVNACRHRGNAICQGRTGNAKRGFLCQYHLWSYDLDGRLKGCCARRARAASTRATTRSSPCRWTPSAASSSSTRTPVPSRWWSGSARTRWRSWRPTTSN
jgi:nitrite reductase/ring-hydroxylating ferredoxin subunit